MILRPYRVRKNMALALVFAVSAMFAVEPLESHKIAAALPTAFCPHTREFNQSDPLTEPSNEKGVEDDQLDSEWDENLTRVRLISTGIAGGGVLSLLMVLFGYFRLNHATRGFYSRRLQLGAASLAILIALACYLLIVAFN